MSSKRYMVTTQPVEHMNGKLSSASEIVHNEEDTNESSSNGFYYGYRKANNISRFAVREKARNLTTNPYTTAETATKNTFTTSVAAVATGMANADILALIKADFDKQTKYIYLRNFAIAKTIENNGVLPWSAS